MSPLARHAAVLMIAGLASSSVWAAEGNSTKVLVVPVANEATANEATIVDTMKTSAVGIETSVGTPVATSVAVAAAEQPADEAVTDAVAPNFAPLPTARSDAFAKPAAKPAKRVVRVRTPQAAPEVIRVASDADRASKRRLTYPGPVLIGVFR